MTVPTDLRRCTGWFTCADAWYDAGAAHLTDRSGLGFHMPLASGTKPAFSARSGVSCQDLDNTFYFETFNRIVVEGSVVMKFHTDAFGSPTGVLAILHMAFTMFAGGDHVALTPLGPWESYDVRQVSWISPSRALRVTNLGAPSVTTGALPADTWQVATAVYNWAELTVKVKIGASATLTGVVTPEPTTGMQMAENRMRFGYLKATGGLTSPQHFSVAEIAFFQDDILVNQSALAASLVASWS